MPEFRRGFCRIVRRRDDIGPVLDDVLEEKRAGSLPLLRTADKRLEVLHDQKVGTSAQRFRRVVERPGRCGASAAQLRAAGAHDVRAVEPVHKLGGELRAVRHAEHQQINNIRLPTFAQQIFHAPQVNFTKKGPGICQALFSGTPGWIRTSGLPLRSSKKLVFNRVPACPVMSEKPWNIKDISKKQVVS